MLVDGCNIHGVGNWKAIPSDPNQPESRACETLTSGSEGPVPARHSAEIRTNARHPRRTFPSAGIRLRAASSRRVPSSSLRFCVFAYVFACVSVLALVGVRRLRCVRPPRRRPTAGRDTARHIDESAPSR
ncbi:hypothetical protein B0H17DRAFT_1110375 [Mycena rosella]|uniref:Uncharacterized protein n=1 Tax=Mycena rosella TaxID=1033263 RepID=A0AAD7BQX5_MYCRO|nr:hypothetical protein B0H17DRAFT_1110375 [Mycena rosella]